MIKRRAWLCAQIPTLGLLRTKLHVMGLKRTATSCSLVTELLQRLLDRGAKTRLIICSTKAEFLIQLACAIRSQDEDSHAIHENDLLARTIGVLANSSNIQLGFCPSLESLRAYLSVDHAHGTGRSYELKSARQPKEPLLVILDMVALHSTTTEFSAQGLSRTFAAAVEFAAESFTDLIIYECKNAMDLVSTNKGASLWDTKVPFLNGSVRLRSEQDKLGGRAVTVREIAQRWFEFGSGLDA